MDLSGEDLVECDDAAILGYARCAHKTKLLKLRHLLDQTRRAMGVTEPPTRHSVGLAEAVNHQDVVVPVCRSGKGMIAAKRPINLVTDQEDVAPTAEFGQGTHFIGRADDAGRI